jgi:transposase-like protein
MTTSSRRLELEKRTIAVMIAMYHRGMHVSDPLCPDCAALLVYALKRIEKCPYGENKPTCANCTIHCYAGLKRGGVSPTPEMREQVRAVMLYAGPRMLLRHPVLALLHLWDGCRRRA